MLAINFFEKNDKKRGCISGIIGLDKIDFNLSKSIILSYNYTEVLVFKGFNQV